MQTIRWGLLSTARINRKLIPAIRSSKHGELVAVASRSLESANTYANEWNIPIAFGSYTEMLDSGEIDVVYIGLPNHLHAEWSVYAMQAGLHVLCEKPLTISLEDADAMISASSHYHKYLAEAFMYRHNPQTKIAKGWVKDGRLGDVIAMSGVFTFALKRKSDIRLISEYGGGSLWDVGVYPLSYAQYLMEEIPQWVFADQWIGEEGVDKHFSAHMHYKGGVTMQFSSGFEVPFHTYFEIIGTEGRLTMTRPFVELEQSRMIFYPTDGKPSVIEVPVSDLYLGEVEDMHTSILDNTQPLISLQESRGHIQTVLALYQSAASRMVEWL